MDKIEKIDCTTCKYGYEDERLGIPMCHHPKRFSEDCVDFNMHKEKHLEGKSDKSLEAEITSFFNNFLGLEMINWDWHCDTLTMASDAIRTFAKHFFELGKKDMKEQMLKDAAEGEIYECGGGSFGLIEDTLELGRVFLEGVEPLNERLGNVIARWLDMPNEPVFKGGEKVRIVVLKAEEE